MSFEGMQQLPSRRQILSECKLPVLILPNTINILQLCLSHFVLKAFAINVGTLTSLSVLSWSRLSFSLSALVVKESATSQSCIRRSGAGNLRHEIEVGPKWIGRKTLRESDRIAFTCYGGLCVKPTTNPSSHFLLDNCRIWKLSGTLVLLSDRKWNKSDVAKFNILQSQNSGKRVSWKFVFPTFTRYTAHGPHFPRDLAIIAISTYSMCSLEGNQRNVSSE